MSTERLEPAVLVAPRQPVVDYDAVRVGDDLPPISFVVTAADVEDYRDSVGSPCGRPVVATMHLLALTLAAITERMPLPPTCVHVGQELEWCGTAAPDSRIHVRFALLSRRSGAAGTLSAFSLHLASEERELARGRILLQS